RHARRRGRAPDRFGARGSRGAARAAGRDRPAHLPRDARVEARHLVPAGRALLDVPADRGRPVRRADRRGDRRDALAGAQDADVTQLDRAALLRLAATAGAAAAVRFPRPHPAWQIVFVNHALTNPFFVPAKYGSQDAAGLLGVHAVWTGSKASD